MHDRGFFTFEMFELPDVNPGKWGPNFLNFIHLPFQEMIFGFSYVLDQNDLSISDKSYSKTKQKHFFVTIITVSHKQFLKTSKTKRFQYLPPSATKS